MRRLAVLVFALGCGHPDPPGDLDASVDEVIAGCAVVDHPAKFKSTAEFAPAVRGTLARWEPDGRWFLTGTAIDGISSLRFDRTGSRVLIDHDDTAPASLNDTEMFSRIEFDDGNGGSLIRAYRISNQRPDGTLRAERATCALGECTLCTARLIRATHHALEGEGDHLTLVGQLADPAWGRGYTFNVRIAGTLAYLIRQDGLHIIETADPAHPVELGRYRRANLRYSNDVKLVEAGGRRFALLADTPVDVVDVTNPAVPVLVAEIAESSHTLFTETRAGKTLAYLGNYDGSGPVYDVTDPALPVKLGSFPTGGSLLHDLSVDGGIAYLNAWNAGFLVVDYTAPAAPRLLGSWAPTPIGASHSNWTTTAGGRHIALHGEEGYNAHLNIIDVDPASPSFMTSLATWQTRPWISIHNLMAFDAKAYLTHYQDGVRVLDLSNPVHPTQVGYYNTWDPQADEATSAFFEGAVGLDVDRARKLIFVADSPRGLLILRDDTP